MHCGSFAAVLLPRLVLRMSDSRNKREANGYRERVPPSSRREWQPPAGGRRGVGASDAALGPFDIQMRLRRLWTPGMSLFSLARGQPCVYRLTLQDSVKGNVLALRTSWEEGLSCKRIPRSIRLGQTEAFSRGARKATKETRTPKPSRSVSSSVSMTCLG